MTHDKLERELRHAARSVDGVSVSSDAWQENQRRLRSAGTRRSRLARSAAGLVGVLAIGAVAVLAQSGGDGGMPAGGSDDAFATQNILGEIVEAETLTVDGQRSAHEIVLTDTTGDGPVLCDRFVSDGAGGASGGGCTPRQPGADDVAVAFDWLSGTDGTGDLRGVLAGVDDRVRRVQVWMHNGDLVLASLHPTGWEDTKMFAVTLTGDAPVPQRLVAYGRAGQVLQAVELRTTFGPDWLPRVRACQGRAGVGGWPMPGAGGPADVAIAFGTSDALVTAEGHPPVCLDPLRAAALAGWTGINQRVVVATAPEVATVRVTSRDGVVAQTEPTPGTGSLLQGVVFSGLDESVLQSARLVALDASGQVLDEEFVRQPPSP